MIKKVVNIYIVYEITASSPNNADPTLTNSLFGAVRLTDILLILISTNILAMVLDLIDFSFPGGGHGSRSTHFRSEGKNFRPK